MITYILRFESFISFSFIVRGVIAFVRGGGVFSGEFDSFLGGRTWKIGNRVRE